MIYALSIVGIVLFIILLYLFFAGTNINRDSTNRDSVDKLKNTTTATRDINNELKGNSEDRQRITDEIEQHNRSAINGIDEALGIIERAKKRNSNK